MTAQPIRTTKQHDWQIFPLFVSRPAAWLLWSFAVWSFAVFCGAVDASGDDDTAEVLFVRRIQPLLHEKCLACHGNDPSDIQGGLDMRSMSTMLIGGDHETPVIVPHRPKESPLFLAIQRTIDDWSPMPPKEADRLDPDQIKSVHDWIAGGAPWPTPDRVAEIEKQYADQWSAEDGTIVPTSGGQSAEWTNRRYKLGSLWAYQPVEKRDPSHAPQAGSNPIDGFIEAMMPRGLQPAPAADRLTLLRRMTFDLTGLPPTLSEMDAFLNDARSDEQAIAVVIERLLDSPHYGERMAQHWLDVVRYADSAGFANDYERGNAWRYRDYVVRSFNADKPYDRFIREQIAGDELDPGNPEMLIATGFLRMGPWELTGMEVAKIARQRFLDDVTNSVGETFLAHSLQCARCHDHKFDPIPIRDYYAVQAVFATTQLCERSAPFLPQENTQGFEEQKFAELRRSDYLRILERLDRKALEAAEAWYDERKQEKSQWLAAVAMVSGGKNTQQSVFSSARRHLLQQGIPEEHVPPRMLGWTPEEIGLERIARKGIERLAWELDRYQPYALSVYNGLTPHVTAVYRPTRVPDKALTEGELEETMILAGGDPFGAGPKVKPGVLSALSALNAIKHEPIPTSIEGRRLAFANWVASADNPLTTRTIVNRVWMWHFGEPIAGNPNNFGSTGKPPTHPELLDWLAATFVEKGWSFKELHRQIMSSQTYRRSSVHPDRASLIEKDPLGTSYAVFKPRRLSAEELRDAVLAVTGELNPEVGGIPVRPEINLEAALQPRQVMGTFATAWVPNPRPEQRHRRSLYTLKLRGLSDPAMEVFNAPALDFSCERRETSVVTPQVFTLLNSQTSQSRALALAARVLKEEQGDTQALSRLFRLLFGRPGTPVEIRLCLTHWHEMLQVQSQVVWTPTRPPLEVRRDAIEENTGEKFSFVEKLYANADFIPDLQPSDCDARTRALADVCLALLNTNQFAYVY